MIQEESSTCEPCHFPKKLRVFHKKLVNRWVALDFIHCNWGAFGAFLSAMSLRRVDAILWRSYLAATSSALWEQNHSQYYFELPRTTPDYDVFFKGHALQSLDERGNRVYTLRLARFDGERPLEPYDLTFTRLRDGVARSGNWQVLNQRGEMAYGLWQRGRGPTKPFQEMDEAEQAKHFIIIARDITGQFHGRWIRSEDFESLPNRFQKLLMGKHVGWSVL